MKITNDFPLHHDWLSQFSKTVTISQMPQRRSVTPTAIAGVVH
jgi:hypothetical protein